MALIASFALVAVPALAATPIASVEDPSGTFTGEYNKGDTDGDGVEETGTQKGYVGVYQEGVVACNGNPSTPPGVGYVWVGPGLAATNTSGGGAAPANAAGVGNNHENVDGSATGESPCPESDPAAVND